MGVLACDREGCTNVMCDYIIDYGRRDYICEECRNELIALKNTWNSDISRDTMKERIRVFMGSESRDNNLSEYDRARIDEMFGKLPLT